MPREKEAQAGVLSGLVAALMIVALSVMALSALQPQREPNFHMAELRIPAPSLPTPHDIIPDAG